MKRDEVYPGLSRAIIEAERHDCHEAYRARLRAEGRVLYEDEEFIVVTTALDESEEP